MVPGFKPGTLRAEICFSSTGLLSLDWSLAYIVWIFYLAKAINQMPSKEISKEFLLLQK